MGPIEIASREKEGGTDKKIQIQHVKVERERED
jgi:hypothetical protein